MRVGVCCGPPAAGINSQPARCARLKIGDPPGIVYFHALLATGCSRSGKCKNGRRDTRIESGRPFWRCELAKAAIRRVLPIDWPESVRSTGGRLKKPKAQTTIAQGQTAPREIMGKIRMM